MMPFKLLNILTITYVKREFEALYNLHVLEIGKKKTQNKSGNKWIGY